MKKVLGIVMSLFVLTGCAPLTLDSSTAREILFSKDDFSTELTEADDPRKISEQEQPIFNASEACEPDARLAALIEEEGVVLASSDLVNAGSFGVYIHQDVLEFDTPQIAGQFLDLVREGLEDSDCAYNSNSETTSFATEYRSVQTSNDFYSVNSDDSVAWLTDSTIYAEVIGDLSSDSLQTVIRQNKYVLVLKASVYRVSDVDVSVSDLKNDFSTIVRQFVSGGKVQN
jgi:hypothetical protein